MGLDWNPANKPIPGREAEFAALKAALDAEIFNADEDQEQWPAADKFDAGSISPAETLGAPVVGVDEVANKWAREFHREHLPNMSFAAWLKEANGMRVPELAPPSVGLPRYNAHSEEVNPYTFCAEYLTVCEDVIGAQTLAACYEDKSASELVAFGKQLLAMGQKYAQKHRVTLPPKSDEFDPDAPERKADIIIAAGEWCIFWGEHGHALDVLNTSSSLGDDQEVDEEEYESRMDRINARVEARFPDGAITYSAYPEDENGLPIDNLDEIAINGRCYLKATYNSFWGKGKDYLSAELNNPTWWHVLECANASVAVTGDEHHVFLEGVDETGDKHKGVPVYEMQFGS
jgi:hypothetical protein